jgi:hypothetical protein
MLKGFLYTARKCSNGPPSAWLGIDMDWPLNNRNLGALVTYTCPFMTKTNIEELAGEIWLFGLK